MSVTILRVTWPLEYCKELFVGFTVWNQFIAILDKRKFEIEGFYSVMLKNCNRRGQQFATGVGCNAASVVGLKETPVRESCTFLLHLNDAKFLFV